MDLLQHLTLGFSVAVSPVNLLYAFVGVLVGVNVDVGVFVGV